MKIGRVYPNFQENLLYAEHYLAKEFKKDGHETVFITSDQYLSAWEKYLSLKNGPGVYQRKNYTLIRLKAFHPFEKAIYKNPVKLWHWLFRSNFDVLHLNSVGTFSTMMVLWMVVLKGKGAPPVIISDHSDTRTHSREGKLAQLYYAFFRFQLKFLKHKIKKIITFNDLSARVVSNRFGLSKSFFKIIPLGFDQDTYYHQPDLLNDEPKMVIGYAGKITPQKRMDFLMDVLNEMDFVDDIRLIIVGMNDQDPYCQQLREKAKAIDLDVEFRPFANSQELSEFYNHIDLAVYPGGISITTIEASACGVPVVIYESIEGLEERVKNGRGKLFKTKEELNEILEHYYQVIKNNGIDRKRIAENTKNEFAWSKIKDQYLNVYKSVINEL